MRNIILLVIISVFSASISFAAEEEGLIQKIRNKLFQKKPSAQAVSKQPATVKKEAPLPPAIQKEKEAAAKRQTKHVKDMTKEELKADVEKIVGREDDVLKFVPGLSVEKGADGKDFVTYKGIRLEAINKEGLLKLVYSVRAAALRIRTDRLNRQLDTINRMQRITAGAGPKVTQVKTPPPQPPTIPALPRTSPTQPRSAPQVQRPPSTPPTPPPTRR